MGLLRRAAVAGGTAETGGPGPGGRTEPRKPRGPGLMGRTLKAQQELPPAQPTEKPVVSRERVSTPAAPTVRAAEAERASPPSQLSIELADGGSVLVSMPVRVEAAPREPASPTTAGQPSASQASSSAIARTSAEVFSEILTAIASLRGGMELPSRLFGALTSLLGARKAAFLLYDPVRLVYAPWAFRGFDQTTLHRMRIPLGANEAWNALANGRPLILREPQPLSQFQPFFSSREFSSIEKLVLVPFIAEEKLVAVFLITSMDSPLATDDELVECLARAAEAGAPRVQEARAARVAAAVSSGSRPEAVSPQDEMSRFLETVGASRSAVLLVALSLEDFSRGVLLSHHDLDPFRLHEDLVFFLGSFLADIGRALPVRQGRFTLALPEFDRSGLEVLSHQLALFLHGLLGDSGGRDPARAPKILKVSAWPADGPNLRTLVESLSSS
jgi:hypothetical protein